LKIGDTAGCKPALRTCAPSVLRQVQFAIKAAIKAAELSMAK
jgi:hypothetical protein